MDKHNFINRVIKTLLKNKRYDKLFQLVKVDLKHKLFNEPISLIVETGTTCNIRCPTCPAPRDIIVSCRPKPFMSLKEFKTIIDNSNNKFFYVRQYWSNEPLLNKDTEEMIKYCDKKGLFSSISTNATLLTEERARKLIESGLDEIILSFDGLTKEVYEDFRYGANFEIVKKNIETLCRLKKEMNSLTPWTELQFI